MEKFSNSLEEIKSISNIAAQLIKVLGFPVGKWLNIFKGRYSKNYHLLSTLNNMKQ